MSQCLPSQCFDILYLEDSYPLNVTKPTFPVFWHPLFGSSYTLNVTKPTFPVFSYPLFGRQLSPKWAATWQNQQNDMCAQRRLRSEWASTQSDHSLRCQISLGICSVWSESLLSAWGNIGPLTCYWVHSQMGGCPGWSESSLGTRHFAGFVMWLFKYHNTYLPNVLISSPPLSKSINGLTLQCTRIFPLSSYKTIKKRMSHFMRNPVYAICEQQRCRSACASALSDQHFCSFAA